MAPAPAMSHRSCPPSQESWTVFWYFQKLIPKWHFKSSSTITPNALFHKEAGLLGSELTCNDCFLLEMAQDGLAFGAAPPTHQ